MGFNMINISYVPGCTEIYDKRRMFCELVISIKHFDSCMLKRTQRNCNTKDSTINSV